MRDFKPYRRIELRHQGEMRKYFIIGPMEENNIVHFARMRDIITEMREALECIGPDIQVTLTSVEEWDSSETGPVPVRSAMVGQMIHIFKETLFTRTEDPKFEWTIGGVLKTLWKNLMEFLDEFGENAAKGTPDPFGNTHNWV